MDFRVLESYFNNTETLDKALEYLDSAFKKVNYWSNLFQKGLVHDNPAEINKALIELSGAYSDLRTAQGIAEYQKQNRELEKYCKLKVEVENSGNKFVSASADKESSAFVGQYRRVRNIIEAYKESAEKAITALQNINNNLDKVIRKNPTE